MEGEDLKQYGVWALIAAAAGWVGSFLKRKDLHKYLPKSATAKLIDYLKEQLDKKDIELAESRKENTELIKALVRRKNPKDDKESDS